jgi:tRNA-splicing ligase RtcB (3'-phosphate/5'-hydroxy nucleic acid ligase)
MKPRQLANIGVPNHAMAAAVRGCASAGRRKFTGMEIKAQVLEVLKKPSAFLEHADFGELASAIVNRGAKAVADQPRAEAVPYQTWGTDIDPGAHAQMAAACSLPVAVAGALMPDAHVGYGLPIGGVLATEGAVIPYAVGVDIACRMMMTVFELPPERLEKDRERFENILERNTLFGTGQAFKRKAEHAVMDEDWGVTAVTKMQKDKAAGQLGTSGSGNHFVEFGELEVFGEEGTSGVGDPSLSLRARKYVALLSHSGSRGPGAAVASHYSALARRLHPDLPKELAYLAWLDMEKGGGEGAEYWAAMELMGRFASANHHVIHEKVIKDMAQMGATAVFQVENHHNFAWKERHAIVGADGRVEEREVIVHRKGATPAGEGVLGLIPGSMAAPGYLVVGRGHAPSLSSASHGAGRKMSRTKARESTRWSHVNALLKERGVHLMSAGLDESPHAYKDIEEVMAAQAELVRPLARFMPRIVRMAPEGERAED